MPKTCSNSVMSLAAHALIGEQGRPRQGSEKTGQRQRTESLMDKPTITLAKNKCYVDGQWIGEPKLPVTNKATGD